MRACWLPEMQSQIRASTSRIQGCTSINSNSRTFHSRLLFYSQWCCFKENCSNDCSIQRASEKRATDEENAHRSILQILPGSKTNQISNLPASLIITSPKSPQNINILNHSIFPHAQPLVPPTFEFFRSISSYTAHFFPSKSTKLSATNPLDDQDYNARLTHLLLSWLTWTSWAVVLEFLWRKTGVGVGILLKVSFLRLGCEGLM